MILDMRSYNTQLFERMNEAISMLIKLFIPSEDGEIHRNRKAVVVQFILVDNSEIIVYCYGFLSQNDDKCFHTDLSIDKSCNFSEYSRYLLTKSHSGDASTKIFGPVNFVWVKGDPPVSSSGITENRPRCRKGDPCGINRKRPTEVSGGGATDTLNRPCDCASEDSISWCFLPHL